MINRLTVNILSLLLVFGASQALAQNIESITLEQAVNRAIEKRYELQADAQRMQTLDQDLKANRLRYVPVITAQADLKYNLILPTSIVPIGAFSGTPTDEVVAVRFGTNWANGAGLSLKQTIFDPSLKGDRELAMINSKLVEAQKAQTAESITIEVARSYYALLVAETELKSGMADSSLVMERISDLAAKVNEGRALAIDLQSAQIDSANARLNLADIRRNVADWQAVLAYQIGMGAGEGVNLRCAESLEDLINRQRNWLSNGDLAAAENPTYLLQSMQIEQSKQLLANERAGFKPTLSLNAYLGANHFSNKFDIWKGSSWFPSSYVGLNLTVPLTEGFIRQQRILRQGLTTDAERLDLLAIQSKMDLDLERAKIAFDGAQQALENQTGILQLNQQKLALTQARLDAGRATSTELAANRNDLAHAQVMYLRRAYEVLLADLELRRVCGLLEF